MTKTPVLARRPHQAVDDLLVKYGKLETGQAHFAQGMTEMHVYSYARISSDMQAESSIDDQHRVCRNYAAKLGWVIHAEFSDVGIGGAALGNRP